MELTIEGLKAAKFRGPVRFYDGAKGMARQDFESVDEPRFGYFWRRENRQDRGRTAFMVDGKEVADLDEAIKLLSAPVDPDSPAEQMKRAWEEIHNSPRMISGYTTVDNQARINADAGPFAMVRAMMDRSDNAWHNAINAYADTERAVDHEWPHWLYNTKTAFQEASRAQYLFRADAEKDTDLRCALGVKCRGCPILTKIEETMVKLRDNPKFPRDIQDTDIIAAKTMTCIGHILTSKDNGFIDGAFFRTESDRDFY